MKCVVTRRAQGEPLDFSNCDAARGGATHKRLRTSSSDLILEPVESGVSVVTVEINPAKGVGQSVDIALKAILI